MLYRGFLLPALAILMPLKWAIPTSSILFAVHHLNVGGIIPLTVLGFAWAIVYAQSRNLLVTILVHALWNSRVFLGTFNTFFIGLPFFCSLACVRAHPLPSSTCVCARVRE